MNQVTATLALLGLAGSCYTFLTLAQLSRRLGQVTKMRPYYRFYYLSVLLAVVAFVSSFWHVSVGSDLREEIPLYSSALPLVFSTYLPLALASLIALLTTWRYWGWLFGEKE